MIPEVKNPYAARRTAIDLQEGVSKLKQFPQIGLPVILERLNDSEIIVKKEEIFKDKNSNERLIRLTKTN